MRNAVAIRYERDELRGIRLSEEGSSQQGGIFHRVGLTGDIIRGALDVLADRPEWQVARHSVLCVVFPGGLCAGAIPCPPAAGGAEVRRA